MEASWVYLHLVDRRATRGCQVKILDDTSLEFLAVFTAIFYFGTDLWGCENVVIQPGFVVGVGVDVPFRKANSRGSN